MSDFIHALSQPWAIEPGTLSAIVDLIERGQGEPLARTTRRTAGRGQYRVSDGVAEIPVRGVITKSVSLFDTMFGDGGTEIGQIRAQVADALANDDVHTILFDIDSPGGTVAGVPELADEIAAAGESKHTVAFTDGMMASAAYWLGSAAKEVVSSKASQVGSIGVYAALTDLSVRAHQAGVKREIVKYGRYKGGGTAGTAIDPDTRQQVQESVNTFGEMFDAAVMARRGFDGEQMAAAGEGRLFIGAKALEVGLIDAVGTYEGLRRQLQTTGGIMPKQEAQAALATEISAVAPELINTIKAEAVQEFCDQLATLPAPEPMIDEKAIEAKADEVAAVERKRARDIVAVAFEGQSALVATLISDGVSTDEAQDRLNEDRRRRLAGSSPASTAAIESDAPKAAQTDEEMWTAEYEQSKDLRTQFSNAESYVWWKAAERAGAIKS